MITTLIGSRSICSWRTTVHPITPQRTSVSSLLFLAWEVKRLTQNHPAIYRRVLKSTFYLVELHSISTHCPGLPTGPQSVFHTVVSLCSSSASFQAVLWDPGHFSWGLPSTALLGLYGTGIWKQSGDHRPSHYSIWWPTFPYHRSSFLYSCFSNYCPCYI